MNNKQLLHMMLGISVIVVLGFSQNLAYLTIQHQAFALGKITSPGTNTVGENTLYAVKVTPGMDSNMSRIILNMPDYGLNGARIFNIQNIGVGKLTQFNSTAISYDVISPQVIPAGTQVAILLGNIINPSTSGTRTVGFETEGAPTNSTLEKGTIQLFVHDPVKGATGATGATGPMGPAGNNTTNIVEEWFHFSGITLAPGEFLDMVDTTPFMTTKGHVAMYVPCDSQGRPQIAFLQGIVDVGVNTLAPVEPEYLSQLSTPGKNCLYHFDIGTPEGVTDFAIINNGTLTVDFGPRNTSTFSITNGFINPMG